MPNDSQLNPDGLEWSALVGKYVLVGLTRQGSQGDVIEQVQMHGRISTADPERGLGIALEGTRAGESFSLPPDLRSLKAAPPGEYRLRSTGEIVRDPDYLATWISQQPDD